jgi:hypothetical protein
MDYQVVQALFICRKKLNPAVADEGLPMLTRVGILQNRTFQYIRNGYLYHYSLIWIYRIVLLELTMTERTGDRGDSDTPAVQTPIPTLHNFRLALYERIRNYRELGAGEDADKECGKGIEGVWRAIDNSFKAADGEKPDTIKGIQPSKLKNEAFRRQVTRLRDEPCYNNSFTFSVTGNILLLLEVFRVLKITSISDLMNRAPPEPDIEARLIDTQINTEEILDKIDKVHEILEMSKHQRAVRFSPAKICYDMENILSQLYGIINGTRAQYPEATGNTPQINFFPILKNNFFNGFSEPVQLALRMHDVMQNYRSYFTQDSLLHNYCESTAHIPAAEYGLNTRIILLSPLYVLYFFLIVNKRFLLSIVKHSKRQNKKNDSNSDVFLSEYVIDENEIKWDEEIKNIIGDKKISKYIIEHVTGMGNIIKNILSLPDNVFDEKNYGDYLSLMKDVIELFYDLYINHTRINADWLDNSIKKIKTMDQLYSIMRLGISNTFHPSNDHINKIFQSRQRLENIEALLRSDAG